MSTEILLGALLGALVLFSIIALLIDHFITTPKRERQIEEAIERERKEWKERKPSFAIEIEQRNKEEEFSFKDVPMFHQECGGGKIVAKYDPGFEDYELECTRCGKKVHTDTGSNATVKILNTAIDGKEREIVLYKPGGWEEVKGLVVQKTTSEK